LQACLAVREALSDAAGAAVARTLIGNVMLHGKRYSEAAHLYEDALPVLSTAPGMQRTTIETEISLAVCEILLDRAEAAVRRLERAVEAATAMRYQVGLGRAQFQLAVACDRLRRPQDALRFAEQAIHTSRDNARDIATGAQLLRWKLLRAARLPSKGDA
jgi:tetratricopeptide (TPR) repeat protein